MKPIMRVENDLKPHNVETIKKVLEFYETSNRCCAIQATGTGKTYLILRLLEIFNDEKKKAIILAPNNLIITQTKKKMKQFGLKNAEFFTYSKLSKMSEEKINALEYDLIVADELHRTGAKEWGKSFEILTESHSNSKIFGVTATPLRCVDGRDMADEYFDNNRACDISLAEALVREIIPVMPVYVSALYTFEEEYNILLDEIDSARNTNEEKQELMKELKAAKQQLEKANGVSEIIKKHITNYNGKYIVFCKDKKHLYAMKDTVIQWFRDAGYNGNVHDYPFYSMSKDVKMNLKQFEENKGDGLKLLFVIDKMNEGLHLDDIQGCILLRTTTSNIVYYQQIGRAIDAGSDQKRVILDLVSNFNSLKSFNLKEELKEMINRRRNGCFLECNSDFDIEHFFVNDYVQACIDVFNKIDSQLKNNFDLYLDKYKKYIDENGHSYVPTYYEDTELTSFLSKQRKYKTSKELSKEKISILNTLGFEWNWCKNDFLYCVEMVKKYITEGKTINSISNTEEYCGFKIGSFINKQISLYKKSLSDESYIYPLYKSKILTDIGVELERVKRKMSKEDTLNLLIRYKETLPRGFMYTIDNPYFEGINMTNKITIIRQRIKNKEYSDDYIMQLNKIGIGIINNRKEVIFNQKILLLSEYIDNGNKINYASTYKNVKLGSWLSSLRFQRIHNNLPDEYYKKLLKINIDLDKPIKDQFAS